MDLAKAKGPQKLITAVRELDLNVDVLVNNAGVISTEPMLEENGGWLTNLINLNVRALTELTHHFGRQMADRGYGRILNVASVASFQPVPGMAVYAASKAFVLSLTEGLSEELKGTGVTVTALCPGPTKTEMADAFSDMQAADWFLADAKRVAQEGFDALKAGQVIRVPGLANQALVNWASYQPRWLVRTLGGFASRSATLFKPPKGMITSAYRLLGSTNSRCIKRTVSRYWAIIESSERPRSCISRCIRRMNRTSASVST